MSKPTKNEPPSNAQSEGAAKEFSWIKFVSTGVSATAVILLMLGYGVSLAVETTFGVPHSALIDSPFDLLDLSMIAVIQIFSQGSNLAFGLNVIANIYGDMLWFLASVVAVLLIVFVIEHIWGENFRTWRKIRDKKQSSNNKKMTWSEKSGLVLLVALAPVLSTLSMGLLFLFMACCLTVPVIGLLGGQQYIKESVVEPLKCLPVLDTRERVQKYELAIADRKKSAPPKKLGYGASCVVVRKGDASYSGRVVFASSKAMVLFSPHDGRVYRVPTGDSIVEVVGSLSPLLSTK